MSRRRTQHEPAGTAHRDPGMTLIEVVVALGLFAVMATAALQILGAAIVTTRDDKSRLEAVHLASRELEIVRDTFSAVTRGPSWLTENRVTNPNPLPGGADQKPLVVDGVPYTVVRTARWIPVGDKNLSPCDDGTAQELSYLHVKVEVTWPALGDRPPVTMDTVMTPPKGTYSALDGHLGLKVINGQGEAVRDVPITATSSTGVTAAGTTAQDGCVLLAHVSPGEWTLTASTPRYVTPAGETTATVVAHVQPGQLWRGSVEYDLAASIAATIVAPEGYELPPDVEGLPVTLGNSALQPIGARTVAGSGAARHLTGLWPYPSGYQLWAGGCEDGDPALTGDSYPVAVLPDQTAPATLTLGKLEVSAAAGTEVVATHAADRLCTSPTTIRLGTVGADGVLKTSLPYGSWTIGNQTEPVLIGQGAAQAVTL